MHDKYQLVFTYRSVFHLFFYGILAIFSSLPIFTTQAYQQIDRPIILVENSPITIQDLESFLARENMQVNQDNINLAFKELIDNRLLQNEAVRMNIVVGSQILDQQILNIAEQNNISLKQLYDEIQESYPGGFERYREDIRIAILKEQIKQRVILPRINENLINDSKNNDANTIINDRRTKEKLEKQIVIQQIAVQNQKNGAYSKILEAYQRLEMGISFTDVAQIYSEENQKDRGRIIGWIDLSTLDKKLQQAINELKPHQYTQPKKIDDTWYLFKLIDSRSIKQKVVQQMRTGIDENIINEEFNYWLSEIRTQSFVEIKQELLDEYLSQII